MRNFTMAEHYYTSPFIRISSFNARSVLNRAMSWTSNLRLGIPCNVANQLATMA